MGWIEIPTKVENCYQSKIGHEWVEKPVWETEFDEMFTGKRTEFDKLPHRNFLVFFTTELEGQQPTDWEILMMAGGEVKKSKDFGTFIEVTHIYRYGFPVSQINDLDDISKEIESYFPEGLEHLEAAKEKNLYYTYVGWVGNFPQLTTEIVSAMKGVSKFQ